MGNKVFAMKNLLKTIILFTGLSFLATPHAEAEEMTALDVVKNTSDQVLERLRNESATMQSNPAAINEMVDKLIIPNFDFVKMARWVLGKNWRDASTEQKSRFTSAFQKLLVRTYAKSLVDSKDTEIKYLPFHADDTSNRVIVKTEIDRGTGAPLLPIHYRLYKKGQDWKVYDVAVNGVSLVSTYRGSFNSEIRAKGLDALITSLENRS
jgi:phospholipid transport system substrate-binding protein